jgi:Rieske Fe-S protein
MNRIRKQTPLAMSLRLTCSGLILTIIGGTQNSANAISRINSVKSASGTGMPNAPQPANTSSTTPIEDHNLRERGLLVGLEDDRCYNVMGAVGRHSAQYRVDRGKREAQVSHHANLLGCLSDQNNWHLAFNAEEKSLNYYI